MAAKIVKINNTRFFLDNIVEYGTKRYSVVAWKELCPMNRNSLARMFLDSMAPEYEYEFDMLYIITKLDDKNVKTSYYYDDAYVYLVMDKYNEIINDRDIVFTSEIKERYGERAYKMYYSAKNLPPCEYVESIDAIMEKLDAMLI
jgi:hypothetical protein